MSMSEDEIMQKLEQSRLHSAEGEVQDADEVIAEMRGKYGL